MSGHEGDKMVGLQGQQKCKVDPQLELKSQAAKKIDLTIEEAADDMKFSLWRAMHPLCKELKMSNYLFRSCRESWPRS